MTKIMTSIGEFFVSNGLRLTLAFVLIAAGFSTGFGVAANLAAKKTVAVAKGETKALIKSIAVDKKEIAARAGRDIAAERALQTQIDKLSDERDFLQKVLNEKPDPDPNVYLRLGDVRLLNDAATPAVDYSDPARVAAYQEQAYSTLALRGLVVAETDLRKQCSALAVRHDALVDWVERELIAPQLAKGVDLK